MKNYFVLIIIFSVLSFSNMKKAYAENSGNMSDAVITSIINEPLVINWVNYYKTQEDNDVVKSGEDISTVMPKNENVQPPAKIYEEMPPQGQPRY